MNVTIDEKTGKITITLPISVRPSTSGKTNILATTSGFQTANVKYKGKEVKVSVNCTMPKD